MCQLSVGTPTTSMGTGQFNSVPVFPNQTGSNPVPPSGRAPAGSVAVGSFVTFYERIPSIMDANDLSRFGGSIFTVEEMLEASNTLVLRKFASSETFACSSTHRRLRRIDFPDKLANFPEFTVDFTNSDAAECTFESNPFAACSLNWAIRVTRVLHNIPIQTQHCFPNSVFGGVKSSGSPQVQPTNASSPLPCHQAGAGFRFIIKQEAANLRIQSLTNILLLLEKKSWLKT